ncbi:hypothetical protein L9F63_000805 [Diploptera punctata]|uniref:T-complex protein 11-like protein 1 n=1 Tax=Diploptera punctata TaxID=6984 RepID=A0AAD8AKZ9_DIPPU|nr:hypothetical protein L9F63_000805 [Diploptera punctata]
MDDERKDAGKNSLNNESPKSNVSSANEDSDMDVWGAAAANVNINSSRQRHEREGATSNGEDSEQQKRQKTTQGFVIPGVAASPPKFVSLEEIMTAANGMKNMVLAHEIAVDKNFKLEKLEPPENSLHKQVEETVHKAFWSILDEELKEDPPNYTQAMILLEDVKKNLNSLLLPQHTKLKEQISEILDADLIRQQAEKGVLDFQHYAQYVISVMGKMCAPVRDEKIRELTQTRDVISMFKGILETLDLMKLDMANFAIDIFRPDIIANSVEYEKKKFAEFLNVQTDGLQYTRKWLLRHLTKVGGYGKYPSIEDKSAVHNMTVCILGEAYLELLDWDNSNPYPETIEMDKTRFDDLGNEYWQLVVTGTVLLVTVSTAHSLQEIAVFKNKLKEHLIVLLQGIFTNRRLEESIANISEQVLKEVTEISDTHCLGIDDGTKLLIKGQIMDIIKEDHKIRKLVCTRARKFLLQTITSPTAAPLRIPPGLSSLQTELTSLTGQFLRLVSHNRAVFGEYYTDIVTEGIAAAAAQASE